MTLIKALSKARYRMSR